MSELSTLPFTEDEIQTYGLEIPSDDQIDSIVDALSPLDGPVGRILVSTNQPTEYVTGVNCVCTRLQISTLEGVGCEPVCTGG